MSTSDEVRATAAAVTGRPGVVRQLSLMIGAWRSSGSGRAIVQRMLIVVLVIGATVYGQIRLNQWNKPFFDALSRRDINDFLVQLGVFAIIIGSLLTLNVTQRWTVENLKIQLRRGLVPERQSVVQGQSVSGSDGLGRRRIIKQKKQREYVKDVQLSRQNTKK